MKGLMCLKGWSGLKALGAPPPRLLTNPTPAAQPQRHLANLASEVVRYAVVGSRDAAARNAVVHTQWAEVLINALRSLALNRGVGDRLNGDFVVGMSNGDNQTDPKTDIAALGFRAIHKGRPHWKGGGKKADMVTEVAWI